MGGKSLRDPHILQKFWAGHRVLKPQLPLQESCILQEWASTRSPSRSVIGRNSLGECGFSTSAGGTQRAAVLAVGSHAAQSRCELCMSTATTVHLAPP